MATLDETNIFGLTPEQPEKKDDSLSRLGISESGYLNRLAQMQQMKLQGQADMSEVRSARGAEKKVLRDQYFSDLAEAAKDPTQEKRDTALESFFETPFMFQMGQYIPDPTGLLTDIAEAEYSGRKFKESREAGGKGTEFYPGPLGFEDRPFYPDMTPEEAGLKLQQGLAMASIPPGIGGIAGIAQSMIGLPSKVLRSKSMDGQGGGGIGGLSKQEFNQQEIDTKARDGMFISPLNRYLITTAPKNLKGQALLDHIKANQSKGGYKADEIRYTGIEEYLKENPEATTQELIDYASENKPRIVVETLGDEADSQDIFLPERVEAIDPISMEDHSIRRADEKFDELQEGDIKFEPYTINARFDEMFYEGDIDQTMRDNVKSRMADFRTSLDDNAIQPKDYLAPDELAALSRQLAKEDFYSSPYNIIELDEGVGVDLKAYGNDDVGYVLIQDGERVELEGDVRIGTAGEAQNQMKILLRDQGEAYNMSGIDGEVEFKTYVLNKTMPHVNGTDYQEMKLLMPSLEARGFKTFKGHYNEDYEIGTLAKVDSKLDDGTDTMHIPEFQADVHQKGASTGYDTPKDKKYYDEVLIPQAVKDFEAQAKRILGDDEFNRLKTLYADEYNVDDGFLPPEKQYKARDHFVLKKISDKIKSNYRVTPSTWYDYRELDRIRANDLAPEYPHQEYVPAVVKQMVAKAIDEGKDTISFPTSTSILERTGKKPRKVGNIEVAQVSAPTELDKQTYELAKNTEDLETQFTVNPEFPNEQNIYFGNMENVIEHIVDLKSMDRKLKQFPDVDFSSPNTRRQYLDFEITMYRDTLDDPAFNVQALDDFARSYEQKLNELGYEIVERADPTVNPKLQELYDEYPDGVKRSMEADALESTQPLTAKALREGYSHNDFNDLLYNKNTNTFTTGKSLENDALAKITSQGEFVIRDPSLEDIGGAAIKPYATYQSIERAFGSSVAKQIRKLAEEGKIPQSYGSYFYDLADGNRNYNSARLIYTFEKTLPYSLDVNKTIGGEKFITDYDKKIPSELKKIAKDYGGKFEEGKLDAEAVYGSKLNLEGEDLNTFMPDKRLGVNILRITPEMRDKVIKEGMASMYKGGIVNKVKSMDKPIQGNRREM
jgi:hypothetical protein